MRVFAISDLHLSTTVEKPMDIFGDGWQNHFQKICDDWKEKVADEDVVLLGGDMSWGMTLEEAIPDYALIDRLKGQKYVVKGNHDYYWNSLSRMSASLPGFKFIQNNAYRIENTARLFNGNVTTQNSDTTPTDSNVSPQNTAKNSDGFAPTIDGATKKVVDNFTQLDTPKTSFVIAGTRGWNIPTKDSDADTVKIYKRELQRLKLSLDCAKSLAKDGDRIIAMLHFPPFEADYMDTEVTKMLEEYNVYKVLYGHLHGKNVRVTPRLMKNGIEYILTSCDLIDNKLVEVCSL